MMLREPWGLLAVLSIGLAVSGAQAPKTAQAPKIVQPAEGPPPDQAVAPDVSSQVPPGPQEQFQEPADPVAPEPMAAPPPAAAPQPPAPETTAPGPKPEAKPAVVIPAKTPEGRKLQQETATLLELAQQLKVELDKAGTNTLSLEALRKADEIQKMTRSLREEMSRQEQVAQTK